MNFDRKPIFPYPQIERAVPVLLVKPVDRVSTPVCCLYDRDIPGARPPISLGGADIGLAIPYHFYPWIYALKISLTMVAIGWVLPAYRQFVPKNIVSVDPGRSGRRIRLGGALQIGP